MCCAVAIRLPLRMGGRWACPKRCWPICGNAWWRRSRRGGVLPSGGSPSWDEPASAVRWAAMVREVGSVAPGPIGGDRRSAQIKAHAALGLVQGAAWPRSGPVGVHRWFEALVRTGHPPKWPAPTAEHPGASGCGAPSHTAIRAKSDHSGSYPVAIK